MLQELLLVLTLMLMSTGAWAAGQKIGNVSVTDQNPNPVHPGSLGTPSPATFALSLTRDNHNGSTGGFLADLTYSKIAPGITYAPSTPASLSFTPKESSKGFFFTVLVDSTVKPGLYPFTVTAMRNGAAKDSKTYTATLVVGYDQVGPIAVDDSGYATSGLAITLPVLTNDIPDPNLANKTLTITAIQGTPVAAPPTMTVGDTVS